MNSNKGLNLTHSKSTFQWWAIFAIFGIVLAFTSCEKDCNSPEEKPEEYPSLKLANGATEYKPITYVKFVGYEFTNLNIEPGSSQIFILDKGMPSGYEDIYVTVGYKRYANVGGHKSITVDFFKGKTTTITLKGCEGTEGCRGFYLE